MCGYSYFRDAADSKHPTNVKMHPTDFEGFSEKAPLSLKRAAELRTKIQQLQAEADGCEAEGRFCAQEAAKLLTTSDSKASSSSGPAATAVKSEVVNTEVVDSEVVETGAVKSEACSSESWKPTVTRRPCPRCDHTLQLWTNQKVLGSRTLCWECHLME